MTIWQVSMCLFICACQTDLSDFNSGSHANLTLLLPSMKKEVWENWFQLCVMNGATDHVATSGG